MGEVEFVKIKTYFQTPSVRAKVGTTAEGSVKIL